MKQSIKTTDKEVPTIETDPPKPCETCPYEGIHMRESCRILDNMLDCEHFRKWKDLKTRTKKLVPG